MSKIDNDEPVQKSLETMTQSERFMQAARELECDDNPERFAERVKKLAKAPPVHQDKPTSAPTPIEND